MFRRKTGQIEAVIDRLRIELKDVGFLDVSDNRAEHFGASKAELRRAVRWLVAHREFQKLGVLAYRSGKRVTLRTLARSGMPYKEFHQALANVRDQA